MPSLSIACIIDKLTDAHGYLGVDQLLKNQNDAARTHFLWVKEHGNATFVEQTIALAELERLEAKAKAKPPAASKP